MSGAATEGIAIIGMAGRFPGAADVDEFWRNLVAGTESISIFNDEELAASGFDVAALRNDPHFVPARGIVDGADQFDARFFGMTAKEAEVTDPQQRLFLETCWHALENAGYDSKRCEGLIGVYAGVGMNTYKHRHVHSRADVVDLVGEDLITLGNEKDYLATRMAYKLDLHGPALNVNTACSTALVAVGQACQALHHFQCDVALAGGISITFPQKRGALHQEGGFASSDGHTRAFDAAARGTVFSDGLGVVVLKRMTEAIEDGDQVFAVIKGVGINNDGSSKVSFTAPSVDGQTEAIALAQGDAGFDPDTISYVECHGTATPLGDPIEIAALTQAFRMRTARKGFCAIGSVKTNIGHLGTAAGIAGLIKTTLALKNKVLPPSLHYTAPNPKIDFANSPFYVNARLTDWKAGPTPRRAGVSSFGFGGTNIHLVLEEAPVVKPSSPSRDWQLLVLSGKTDAALDATTANLDEHLKAHPELNFADTAFTLQVGRRAFDHRRILVSRDAITAAEALEKGDPKHLFSYERDANADVPSVVFMFPGQGAQYVTMGADLYRTEPVFKEEIDRCAEILAPCLAGLDLREILYPSADKIKEAEALLIQTRITQPALFAIEYALAKLWMSWGIKPAALTGHSLGEYVAACLAGVFSLEDALSLVTERGRLIQSMPHGSMLAVAMAEQELKKILPPTLAIAGVNGPVQCVVSGPAENIDGFQATLTAAGKSGRPLHTSHAFHSAMLDPVVQPFAESVKRVKRGEPTIPFISNLSGTWITAEEARDPQYWARHLRQGVRFADGIKELLKNKSAVFLEVGPGTTLGSLTKFQAVKADNRAILSSLRHAREPQPDLASMLTALGHLWMRGVPVDWTAFYRSENRHRVTLPGYPFERQRYWIEHRAPTEPVSRASVTARKNPDVADWFYVPSWKRSAPLSTAVAADKPQNWLIFLDEGGLGAALAEKLALAAHRVTTVRAGDNFTPTSDGFVLDPSSAEDYGRLLDELLRAETPPQRIAHFWGVTTDDPEPRSESAAFARERRLGFDSLLFLAQAIHKRGLNGVIPVNLVANHTLEVADGEPLAPGKAMVQAFAKVLSQEQPNLACRSIDVIPAAAGSDVRQRLVTQLAVELLFAPSDSVVAYRGDHRWIQTFENVRLAPADAAKTRLRQRGVYLITGGLGKIGLKLAGFLAQNYRARLILADRTGLPPREEWGAWLADHPAEDTTIARIKKVRALEEAGAEVIVLGVDVADKEQLRAGLDVARQKFGDISGVIHGAGVAGPKAISFVPDITPVNCEMHFQAKVHGLLALDEILRGTELDFFLLTSSIATVLGALGAGTYAASNRFMDAFALGRRQLGETCWISVDWDRWQEESPGEFTSGWVAATEFVLTPAEGAEAFSRILVQKNLGHVIVSTADLNARLEPWTTSQISPKAAVPGSPNPAEASSLPASASVTSLIAASSPAPALNDIEKTLAGIWSDLLGVTHVNATDNFFDLGGDSLLLMRVQMKVRELFNVDLAAAELFQYPTVSGLAQRLTRQTAPPVARQPVPLVPPTPTRTVPEIAEANGHNRVVEQPEPRAAVIEARRAPVRTDAHAIAIIGLAGRFPGARNVDQYWNNLVAGIDSTSFFTDEELAASDLNVAEIRANRNYVAARGIIDEAEWFDAGFFNIGAKEAEVMDPQHRVFLETAWEALENAGYDPAQYAGYVGVFAGMASNTYYLNNLHTHPELVEQVGRIAIGLGNEKDFIATRTAYKLNLRGPAISTNTACSTSLVAVCLACQSLVFQQCDIALAGGIAISFPQKRANLYQQGSVFSPDGVTRPFDAKAAGTYFSDGVGVVALKRLDDAIRDGDRVHAVIKGIGLNNDGSDKVGYTAPSVQGQSEAILRAQAHAGVSPESISYVEAHGTATPLGDPIEIAALTQAFRAGTEKKNFCAIGSVKGNFGHCDAAAGIAGLIKTTLALKHKQLPATLHFSAPNPKIDFANSPFFVNAKLTDWKAGPTPRRAGISSFGIGGTNAHVVVEEAPALPLASPSRPAQLLLFSAKSAKALDAMTARFVTHLKANPDINLADAAYTLQVGRRVFLHRRMVVVRDVADAIGVLEKLDMKRVITRQTDAKDCPVAFLFPGQGVQYVNMCADLYRTEPVFRAEIDRCAEILTGPLDLNIREVLFPAAGKAAQAEALLIETRITQPALFVIEYALAKLWLSWGVAPQAMASHSLGEFVAACLAGVFTLEEALTIVAARSRLVQEQPGGSMLAVRLPEKELVPLLPEGLSMAALNSPALAVVAGPFEAAEKLEEVLNSRNIVYRRLDTSHAFHSAMMDPVIEPFAEVLNQVHFVKPAIPYVSNVTGQWITPGEAVDPRYWARQVRETVRFAEGVGEILKDSQRVLLEVGPGRTLATFANQHPDKTSNRVVLSSLSPEAESEIVSMLEALGRLWLAGKSINWVGFYAHERRCRVPLPNYPFQRQRYWIERRATAPVTSPTPAASVAETAQPQAPRHERPEMQSAFAVATSELERKLAAIWQEVFSLQEIGVDDSYFDLGGDSLLAVPLINKINAAVGCDLPIPVFFQNPTIRKLAPAIEELATSGPSNPTVDVLKGEPGPHIITYRSHGRRPPLFFLHGDWAGGGFYCGHLQERLGNDQPFYTLPPYRSGKTDLLPFEEMVDKYYAVIRAHTPRGPYIMGGYCIGGMIALEVARRFVAEGDEVSHLFQIDVPLRSTHEARLIWGGVNAAGDVLKWDLLKKIHVYDYYPLALLRWLNVPLRSKILSLGRRLKLTTAGSASPTVLGVQGGEPLEVLQGLDYNVYFLSAALHEVKPLSIPTSLYFAEQGMPRSFREKSARGILLNATLEMIPGNHTTCITRHANVPAEKMAKILDAMYLSQP
jgi:acyl transferase domain-containing protein